ncbi:MAG: hypothetical protein ACREJC_05635, partial [Tepidisphaeraceae bacterium]
MTSLTPITIARMADPIYGPELTAFCASLTRARYASLVIDRDILLVSRVLPRLRGNHHTKHEVRSAFRLPPKAQPRYRYWASPVSPYCRFLAEQG